MESLPHIKTMPFTPSVSISKSTGSFANLIYKNPKTNQNKTLTFALKDCYSHFGVKADKNKTFSVGISLDNPRQIEKFRAIEKRCEKISPVPKPEGQKRFLKCLYEKGDYTTLYLKLSKEQTTGVKANQACSFSGTITFSVIYLGDEEKGYGAGIIVRVGETTLKPVKKRKPTTNVDDSPISDTDDESEDED